MSWLTESKDYTERMNRAYGKLDESKMKEKNEYNVFNEIRTSYYGLYRTLCDKYGEEAVAQMIINHMNCDLEDVENAIYEVGQENGIFLNFDDFEDKFGHFEESKKEASVPETFSKSDEIVTHTIRAKQEVDKAVTAARELEDELVGLYNDGKIHEGFDLDANIKESKLKESEDGWNEDVLENCGDVLDRIYDLTYEIKNCIKGAYTGCETYEELADYIRSLADDLRDAADGVAYCCDDEDLDESKKMKENLYKAWAVVNEKDATIIAICKDEEAAKMKAGSFNALTDSHNFNYQLLASVKRYSLSSDLLDKASDVLQEAKE